MNSLLLNLALGSLACALSGCPAAAQKAADQVDAQPVSLDAPLVQPDLPTGQAALAGPPSAAPDLNIVLADGTSRKLADYRGKPLVVNFWAEWCEPCVDELPHFQAAYAAKGNTFEIVAFDMPMARTDPGGFFKTKGFTFPCALDDGTAAKAFGVGPIPHTFFIDRNGNVVHNVVGGMDQATFEANLNRLLSL